MASSPNERPKQGYTFFAKAMAMSITECESMIRACQAGARHAHGRVSFALRGGEPSRNRHRPFRPAWQAAFFRLGLRPRCPPRQHSRARRSRRWGALRYGHLLRKRRAPPLPRRSRSTYLPTRRTTAKRDLPRGTQRRRRYCGFSADRYSPPSPRVRTPRMATRIESSAPRVVCAWSLLITYQGDLKHYLTIGNRTTETLFTRRDQFAPELVAFLQLHPGRDHARGVRRRRIGRRSCSQGHHKSARLGQPVQLRPFQRDVQPDLSKKCASLQFAIRSSCTRHRPTNSR